MDITTTTEPDSTQWNADDFIGSPRTFEITDVTAGSREQPINIHLAGSDRVYRPGKSMRRVFAAAWGSETNVYAGRRVTLYCDPDITFGKDKPGGVRISHLSHIDKPLTVALTVTRGRRAPFIVKPLADAPAALTDEQAMKVRALIKDHGLDRAAAQQVCSQESGRPIASVRDLTPTEADLVIAALSKGDES